MRVGAALAPRLTRALLVVVPMVAISALSHATAGGELAASPLTAPIALLALALSLSALRSWSSLVWWALVVSASEAVFHSIFLGPAAGRAVHEEPEIAHAIAAMAVLVLLSSVTRRFRALIARRIGVVRMLWSRSPIEVRARRFDMDSPVWPVPLALVSSVARRGPPPRSFA